MMKMVFSFLLVLFVLTGCNKDPQNGAAPSPSQSKYQVKTEQTIPEQPVIKNAESVARHLEQLAKHAPNVNGANCIVIGNTAIIGIDVDASMDRTRVGTVKYSVAEALRKDPYGKYAIVTADIDLAQRIREIRADITNGKPISGFAEELSDLVGRVMPTFPKDIQSPDEPNQNTRQQMNNKNL
jgi:YhcN/YlaJ family sporulation lipoprotein